MSPEPQPRLTLLLAATRPEADPLAQALGVEMKAAQLITPEWMLVSAGIGAQRVVAALNRAARQKPVGRVIHFGFAGGLSPDLKPGQIMPFVTIAEPSGRMIALDQPVPRVLSRDEPVPPGPRLLSVPYLIHREADKLRLFKYHNACAVDMESFAAAQACAQLNMPYTPLRAISDPFDMALPSGSETWLDSDGQVRTGRVIRFLLANPSWLGQIVSLGRHSRLASRALVEEILKRLQPTAASIPPLAGAAVVSH